VDLHARLSDSKQSLKNTRSDVSVVIMFTDENIFTVATSKNTQNDRLCTHPSTNKKDVATKGPHKQYINAQSLMASSAIQYTSLTLIDLGVKVSEEY